MSGNEPSLVSRLMRGGRRSHRGRNRQYGDRSGRPASAFEQLEGRRLLAITTPNLPGDQAGASLVFVADNQGPNTLTVELRDGFDAASGLNYIYASIDTGDGLGPSDYFNFDKIDFTGAAGVVDTVLVTSPYEVDIVGFGARNNAGDTPLSTTNWQIDALFNASGVLPGDVAFFDLFGADILDVTAATLGSIAASTVGGNFQPTDAGVAGVASVVLEDRGTGISSNAAGDAIRTYGFNVTATNGPIDLGVDIIVDDDLAIVANSGNILLEDTVGGGLITLYSSAGDVLVRSDAGSVAVNNTTLSALVGDISVTAPAQLDISGGPSAALSVPSGEIMLTGQLGLSINSGLSILADRLKLTTSGTALIDLTNVAISELEASVGGALQVVSSTAVTITDSAPDSASVQISAAEFSLTAPAGIRVVDGLNVPGAIILSTWDSGASTATDPVTPTIPVEFVVTGAGDTVGSAFEGELRDMIGYANRNRINPFAVGQSISLQPMSIVFDEAGSPIANAGVVILTRALPAVARPLTFDGTLPDGPAGIGGIVGVDGAVSSAANGLTLATGSSGSTVRDAAFYGFAAGAGIQVASADNLFTGLNLGLNRVGGAGGNRIGIELVGTGALRNVIGVKAIGEDRGNVIADNTVAGVLIRSGANLTSLYGNQIGVQNAGNADGVWVQSSVGTIIGGVDAGLANTIEFNTGSGIRVTNVRGVTPRYGSQIVGNTISNNDSTGVLIEGGMRNVIGGTGVGEGNLMEGNAIGIHLAVDGLRQTSANQIIGNTVTGAGPAGTDQGGILIERGFANTVQANKVSGWDEYGIRLFATSVARGQAANSVIQNTVTESGNVTQDAIPLPVGGGIVVENSSGQIVGGRGANANFVNENISHGILVIGGTGPNAAGSNNIQWNYVGTDASGTNLGNGFDGIRIQGSLANLVQGNTVRFSDLGNDANPAAGISVYDAVSPVAALGNKIVSNSVGHNTVGVLVSGGARTVVGGRSSGASNWVFSNLEDGIRVKRSDATGPAISTVIQRNRIGLAPSSAVAGNGVNGILLEQTVGTVIDSGNVVANSGQAGISVQGGSEIAIGSDASGGNTIEFNSGVGVEVIPWIDPDPTRRVPGRTENVIIAGNLIWRNAGYGVEVGGNDSSDGIVSGVTIGRSAPGSAHSRSANRVMQNGLADVFAGVYVGSATQAVNIYGNTIVNNGGDPIEWAAQPTHSVTVTSASRTNGSRSGQFDVRGAVSREDFGSAETVRVSVYGTNTATSERFLLGQVSVRLRVGVESAGFRILVGSAGKQFDRIEATLNAGLSTVASNSLGV